MSETQTGSAASHRQVGFQEAISLFFNNYLNFEGRSSRGAYWWAALFMLLVDIATSIIDGVLFGFTFENMEPIGTLVFLAILLPSIAVGVRRLHDIGKSGWWSLIAFTVIGLIPLIYWACQPGERQDNRFGPDIEAGRR
ncbi:MAG: DUF805 domain-containing protein [Pseudomonadota bacterium]